MTKRILFSIGALLALLPWGALAESSPQVSVPPGFVSKTQALNSAYELLRDGAYNNEPLGRLETDYEGARRALVEAALPPEPEALWRSRIEYILGRGYKSQSAVAKALPHFEQGLGFAEAALRLGSSSEGWRMRSENFTQLCLLKGAGYLLANGKKMITFAEKAVQLDSGNAAALIILANSKIFPPPLFGGDPAAGVRLMQLALAQGNAGRDDLFNIYSGIGLAYEKLKDRGAAREWDLKALALYPANLFALQQYSRVRG